MITYASLPMNLKTIIVTLLFLTMIAGICTSLIVGKRQGRVTLCDKGLLPSQSRSG